MFSQQQQSFKLRFTGRIFYSV